MMFLVLISFFVGISETGSRGVGMETGLRYDWFPEAV